ncbi:Methyl-accepting chemotaxis protein [Rubrivivax sp. A210]|uniref:hypothetical protein n=1 Tax=Rubrivivax sp. A210 TaxID=2772301 RepID=UPI0019183F91|nr:hypothetical protein [Rubrivivax sp. A210]CAD5374055.1 Methyl-accepting chemotaxis protein [Rubrivivax sp. A210]
MKANLPRLLSWAAFAAGLAAVAWVGAGYLDGHPLALLMTALIAAFYLAGAVELHRYQRATATLAAALAAIPGDLQRLGDWLACIHPTLQNPVRLRVEGERAALPGPALTPYLVGLLVLLGMLGTFLGMVVTLKGTVAALEGSADAGAIRAALAAPVRGLGLAFGTSVAGVAASAMLGLVSALVRRERQQAGAVLDSRIATTLRRFSSAHQREESFKTLQGQAGLMPELVDRLQALMAQMERQGQVANERLLANQKGFHRHTEAVYGRLAASVEASLSASLAESARRTGAAVQPLVEAALAGLAREAAAVQDRLLADGRAAQEAQARGFDERAAALLAAVAQTQAQAQADAAAREEQRLAAWTRSLADLGAALQREWQQAGEQGLARQQAICQALEVSAQRITDQAGAQARATVAEIERLVQAAAEAPRAAAEVIAALRAQLSASLVQDQALLEERGRVMASLEGLLAAVDHAATGQRAAVDALLANSAALLERLGARFGEQVEAGSTRIVGVAAQLTGSAAEVASLGEAFGHAVQLFSASNDKLTAHLERIEVALGKSLSRSDEQLAYYVAQAREIIDLSLTSQKQIVEDLQRVAGRAALAPVEPA